MNEEQQSKGGLARAKSLSQEERKNIAKLAASSRWNKDLPKATHTGEIKIGDKLLACGVLETGKRLLTQETFMTSIGRAGKAKGGTGSFTVDGLPPFLSADYLSPFISNELRESTTPIFFRSDKGARAAGYDALLLPMVCEAYLKFRDDTHAKGKKIPLRVQQIISACDLLTRGLARVGIVALVDEATGYQADQAKKELSKILEAYVVAELRPYLPMFPEEFFKQVYRLHGWEFKPGTTKRPQYIGKFINKYIYEFLPDPVLPKIQELNPITDKGWRRFKNSQFLTPETGVPHLDKQISTATTLMRASRSKGEFEEIWERAFLPAYQERLPLEVEIRPSSS